MFKIILFIADNKKWEKSRIIKKGKLQKENNWQKLMLGAGYIEY